MPYNLARFDLVSIRLAVDCAQTGSLTAAARGAHLALGAASRRLRELEDALGEPLFERHARGLVPTAAGRV
ncbi:MAG: LysR family transcriptional regulator, partial [Polaromonas sp.]|nr:LysR family transcriptional regulator [Polaromonas sp.]